MTMHGDEAVESIFKIGNQGNLVEQADHFPESAQRAEDAVDGVRALIEFFI